MPDPAPTCPCCHQSHDILPYVMRDGRRAVLDCDCGYRIQLPLVADEDRQASRATLEERVAERMEEHDG